MPPMARLLLVEDHVLVRQSIRASLEDAGFQVIGEVGSGTEAVELARDLAPDLVVMDVRLPDMNGVEATRRICRQRPGTRVVALTAYNEIAYQRALHEAGAHAFVLKTVELSELVRTIQRVIHADSRPEIAVPDAANVADIRLTDREVDVLTCAARGWTNKQIGAHLFISERTVQVHLQAIYQKMMVSSRTEAVSRALALGLIPMADGEDS